MQTRIRYFLVILLLLCLIGAGWYVIFRDPNPAAHNNIIPDLVFNIIRYCSLYAGMFLIVLRLMSIVKTPLSFVYVIPGLLNILVGSICAIFYLTAQCTQDLFFECMVNLFIGYIISIDAFVIGAH